MGWLLFVRSCSLAEAFPTKCRTPISPTICAPKTASTPALQRPARSRGVLRGAVCLKHHAEFSAGALATGPVVWTVDNDRGHTNNPETPWYAYIEPQSTTPGVCTYASPMECRGTFFMYEPGHVSCRATTQNQTECRHCLSRDKPCKVNQSDQIAAKRAL